MRVAVVGGTGSAGRSAVEALRAEGHDVDVLSRRGGVDAYTGDGLAAAFAGVDVVIDTLNSPVQRRSAAVDFFTTTARRVQEAAAAHAVQHLVVLSILGVDRVRGFGYYEGKLAQERTAAADGVPVTVLRAAQFHEFPAQFADRLRFGPVAVVPHMRSQPVAARTVGRHLARLASTQPGGRVELAGPEVHDIADLARRYVRAHAPWLHVLPVRMPGRMSHDVHDGALLATPTTIVDGPTYDAWLASDDALFSPLIRPGRRAARSAPERS